jgi:hypothetical protein
MKLANWLDRVESVSGPVVAWGVAMVFLVAALPATLLWYTLNANWQQA